jgi:hypothetical protein
VARGDSKVLVDGLDDGVTAATTKLAWGLENIKRCLEASVLLGPYRCADLHEVLADRLAVVHGVEGRNLVNAHWGHLEHASDLVHDADAGETVLALAKVKQRHDGGLFVLGRVALEDLIGELEVLVGKLEREGRVVVRLVAVLFNRSTVSTCHSFSWVRGAIANAGGVRIRTTERVSLSRCEPAEKALYWGLGSW